MGYILPITHYQYTQYANRTIRTNDSPFVLLPVVKSSLEKKLHDNENRELLDFSNELKEKQTIDALTKKSTHTDDSINYLLAEITGKGRHFNEFI